MSRRGLIEMTDAEVRAFLESSKTIIINSIGPGGYPHPMPMWFGLDPDGSVRMTTFRASQKVKNLQRDPRVSLLAEAGEEYAQLIGVVLYGRAQVIDDLEVVTQTLVSVTTRGQPALDPAAREGMGKVVQKTAAKRVCILVEPERVVSWDHRKLGGTY
jgi:nitroimidazol reductase NimA-like FMN-containing flavoprotein (pyridoxamine 5'-phosphate oxidase superfamily)